MTRPAATTAEEVVLERTRSAVMNVLVAVGLGIAATGFVLRSRERDPWLFAPRDIDRWAYGGLIAVALMSLAARRSLASRDRLRDPAHRAGRFYRAHLAAALIGALAIPMGFAYGWWILPRLDGVGPFWVVALAAGAMAYPRAHELTDFEEPIPASGGKASP
ncbi:MAG: hypothetical protein U0800_20435 [Isosphaeraceae bacterium]